MAKGASLMVTVTICCPYCGSEDLIRNGHASNGKQKYRCKSCKRQSRENPSPNGYPEERREEIMRAYQEVIPEDQLTQVVTVDKEIAPLTAAPNRTGRFPFIRLFSVWSCVIDTL